MGWSDSSRWSTFFVRGDLVVGRAGGILDSPSRCWCLKGAVSVVSDNSCDGGAPSAVGVVVGQRPSDCGESAGKDFGDGINVGGSGGEIECKAGRSMIGAGPHSFGDSSSEGSQWPG